MKKRLKQGNRLSFFTFNVLPCEEVFEGDEISSSIQYDHLLGDVGRVSRLWELVAAQTVPHRPIRALLQFGRGPIHRAPFGGCARCSPHLMRPYPLCLLRSNCPWPYRECPCQCQWQHC